MRGRIRRALAWVRSPERQRAVHVGVVSLGGSALVWLLKDNEKRFRELEKRGLMPVDDFATVGDVYELDDRVRVLEGKPPRAKIIDVDPIPPRSGAHAVAAYRESVERQQRAQEPPDPPAAPVEAPAGPEGAQEGQEAS